MDASGLPAVEPELKPVRENQTVQPRANSNEWLIPSGLTVGVLALSAIFIPLSNPKSTVPDRPASPAVTEAQLRAGDSLRAAAIIARPDSVSGAELWDLERIVHRQGFGFAHDSIHRRYIAAVLDSAASALKDKAGGIGNYAGAEVFLSGNYLHPPLTEQQERRRSDLAKAAQSERTKGERAQRVAVKQGQIDVVRKSSYCNVSAARASTILDQIPNSSTEILQLAACKRLRIGMTRDEVRASWGRPYDINRSTYSFGVHEQWVYGEWGSNYVYFEDGIVTAIQN